jgi:metallophosphoesterase (TIGR00282 family)
MKILIIGDIYGKTGREALAEFLPQLKETYEPDWIIANGENLTAGNGISARHNRFLKETGVHVVTTGNHLFARQDWQEVVSRNENILRPHNLGEIDAPGSGLKIFQHEAVPESRIAVINLAGRVFMQRCRCPFMTADELLAQVEKNIPIIVDFHAEASSEKLAMFWYLNGRVSAVVGTHTHVQTSDERILPGGTAVISDLGMTGARDGILGVDRETIIGRFVKGYSDKFLCAVGIKKIEGVVIETDSSNQSTQIQRFRLQS